jgi:hypothetical protein
LAAVFEGWVMKASLFAVPTLPVTVKVKAVSEQVLLAVVQLL